MSQPYLHTGEELGVWERHTASEELSNRPIAREDVLFVEYPYPTIYRRHLEELVVQAKVTRGIKQRASRMDTYLITDREQWSVDFVDQSDVDVLNEFVTRCKNAGLETQWVEQGMEDYKRVRAAGIHTPHDPAMRVARAHSLPQKEGSRRPRHPA